MIEKYEEFLILETLQEYLPTNEGLAIPKQVNKLANNFVDTVAPQNIADKVREEYGGKSFSEIIKVVRGQVSNAYTSFKGSGVGEFSGEVGKGVFNIIRPMAKWLSKKTAEYGTVALLAASLIDYILPFGVMDSWFTSIEWKLGIAILISLVIFLITRKKKK